MISLVQDYVDPGWWKGPKKGVRIQWPALLPESPLHSAPIATLLHPSPPHFTLSHLPHHLVCLGGSPGSAGLFPLTFLQHTPLCTAGAPCYKCFPAVSAGGMFVLPVGQPNRTGCPLNGMVQTQLARERFSISEKWRHLRSSSKCVSMPLGPGTEHISRALRNVVHLLTRLLWPPKSFWKRTGTSQESKEVCYFQDGMPVAARCQTGFW